jgi:hypothetical protein
VPGSPNTFCDVSSPSRPPFTVLVCSRRFHDVVSLEETLHNASNPACLAGQKCGISLSGSRPSLFIQVFALKSAHTRGALHPLHRAFPAVECCDRLVVPILSTDEPPVLMTLGNCSCWRAKLAHFVGHLPSAEQTDCFWKSHVFLLNELSTDLRMRQTAFTLRPGGKRDMRKDRV